MCACARLSEMTGKCLLCGFELGPDDKENKRTGSHSQHTCALKSHPCLHRLPHTHSFNKSGTCYSKDCACLDKCSKCCEEGHRVGTIALSPERNASALQPAGRNGTTRSGEPAWAIGWVGYLLVVARCQALTSRREGCVFAWEPRTGAMRPNTEWHWEARAREDSDSWISGAPPSISAAFVSMRVC